MKTKKAIKILREMNKWRRGEPPYGGTMQMPYTSKQYGKAIDLAIKVMEDDLGGAAVSNCPSHLPLGK